jgi:hypothetical protein
MAYTSSTLATYDPSYQFNLMGNEYQNMSFNTGDRAVMEALGVLPKSNTGTLATTGTNTVSTTAKPVAATAANTANNLDKSLSGLYDAQAKFYNNMNDYQNSFMGKASPYVKGFANIASGVSSLANIYLGLKQYKLAKEQLGITREQWAETKKEAESIRRTRRRIAQQYNS